MSTPIWTPWPGGEQPVPDDAIVEVQYRGPADASRGTRIDWPRAAVRVAWWHDGTDDDIVAYRIVEVTP